MQHLSPFIQYLREFSIFISPFIMMKCPWPQMNNAVACGSQRGNIKPGGKQAKLHNTTIPMNNPGPKPRAVDMHGQQQSLVYAVDHPNPNLHGKVKGIHAILKEQTSVWDAICEAAGGEKRVKNVCIVCKASQMEKNWLTCIAAADGIKGDVAIDDHTSDMQCTRTNLCCVTHALIQQQDFLDEKPMIQQYIESQGHICIFLPKFHCELNPNEMYWGWAKHSVSFSFHFPAMFTRMSAEYRAASDSKFSTAKRIMPEILDSIEVKLLQKFFWKAWRYMDAYSYICSRPFEA